MADNVPDQVTDPTASELAPAMPSEAPSISETPQTDPIAAQAPGVPEDVMGPESTDMPPSEEVAFSWQASEYVHHHKGVGWYVGLAILVAVLSLSAILLHYWLELGAFLVMGLAILIYARKPPRTLLYELTPTGISIDGRAFSFNSFRSFGVLPDTEWHTIDLEPVKRFNPRVSILFDETDFEEIVSHLELHLPRVDRQADLVERLSRYLRF